MLEISGCVGFNDAIRVSEKFDDFVKIGIAPMNASYSF
jgi:hypothetical protein